MGVVCIAELILECSGVFLFVEGTIWTLCVARWLQMHGLSIVHYSWEFYHIRPPCK